MMSVLEGLREAYRIKKEYLDIAMEAGKPQKELMEIYKELKELQYQMVQEDLRSKQADQYSR